MAAVLPPRQVLCSSFAGMACGAFLAAFLAVPVWANSGRICWDIHSLAGRGECGDRGLAVAFQMCPCGLPGRPPLGTGLVAGMSAALLVVCRRDTCLSAMLLVWLGCILF
jgi:hypothetical protein